MKKSSALRKLFLIPLVALLAQAACASPAGDPLTLDEVLAQKEDITILVTDSGLGGLSVAADLAARLPDSGIFRNARIVFYNALFHSSGYNSLDSEEEKAKIFDQVLDEMVERYRPDMILIACNTLSVVYENTQFALSPRVPVVGIVETGVDLIARKMEQDPEATAIVFGTRTTIESGVHEAMLVERGFPEEQIVGQAAHRLAGAIERGVESEETMGYIRQFVAEAVAQLPEGERNVFGSFNCTHYGFATDQFAAVFAEVGYPDIELLDPNPEMADFMFRAPYLNRHPGTTVVVEVVSKLEITEQERASIGPLLRAVSPMAADALDAYVWDPNLFRVDWQPPAAN